MRRFLLTTVTICVFVSIPCIAWVALSSPTAYVIVTRTFGVLMLIGLLGILIYKTSLLFKEEEKE